MKFENDYSFYENVVRPIIRSEGRTTFASAFEKATLVMIALHCEPETAAFVSTRKDLKLLLGKDATTKRLDFALNSLRRKGFVTIDTSGDIETYQLALENLPKPERSRIPSWQYGERSMTCTIHSEGIDP